MSNTNINKIGPYIKLFCSDYVDEPHISASTVRSSGEVPQDHSATEEYPKTSDSIVERRPSLSTQISMNEAYRLAIGNKCSLPSPTLTDVILGKDSTSSINEELRLLLSQLSASRGLEAPWVDPGPSPRAYGRGDELPSWWCRTLPIEFHLRGMLPVWSL
jgi:hypothetical protein